MACEYLVILHHLIHERHLNFAGRTLFLIPQALRHVVNPGAILHYDQSIDIFAPLDPGGAELESRWVGEV